MTAPLAERAQHRPSAAALVVIRENGSLDVMNARSVYEETVAHARALTELGIGAGDVVILIMGHSRTLFTVFLGALHVGAVPAILANPNPRLDQTFYAKRVGAVAENATAKAVVIDSELRLHLARVLEDMGSVSIVASDTLDRTPTAVRRFDGPIAAPDDLALLQYTSGTTGIHKGVAHTHRAILDFIDAKMQKLGIGRDDVVVNWLPLYHDLGLISGFLLPLLSGLKTVLISPFHWARDPAVLFRAISEYRGTLCWMPNSALGHCVRAVRESDLHGVDLRSWRILSCGGEPVRWATLRAFIDRFAAYGFETNAVQIGYGMAENVEAATHTTTPERRPPIVDWIDARRLQDEARAVPMPAGESGGASVVSCGSPLPGTEIGIAGPDGRVAGDRHVGEVLVRSSYMLSGGYFRRPDVTAEAVRDGWFHTGDLGYIADGELYVCGRRSDVIILAGRKIHPEDIELIADAVEGVAPGRTVAFGVADPQLGTDRVVVLCEVAKGWTGEHVDIAREVRKTAAHLLDVTVGAVRVVPRGWIIKTSSGKLARQANREKYLAELGVDPSSTGQTT